MIIEKSRNKTLDVKARCCILIFEGYDNTFHNKMSITKSKPYKVMIIFYA